MLLTDKSNGTIRGMTSTPLPLTQRAESGRQIVKAQLPSQGAWSDGRNRGQTPVWVGLFFCRLPNLRSVELAFNPAGVCGSDHREPIAHALRSTPRPDTLKRSFQALQHVSYPRGIKHESCSDFGCNYIVAEAWCFMPLLLSNLTAEPACSRDGQQSLDLVGCRASCR